MKKISILVPCCNVEQYVRQCLDSIKNQTHTNIEVICIDDGSKDSTGAIIDEYVAEDSRFKVIHKANSGYGDSMNKGLEICTGDYIGIVESDDWIEPNMYEVLLSTAEKHDLDLVRCLWKEGPTGTEAIPDTHWIKKNSVYCPKEKEGVFYMPPSIWVALYRRDLLEEGRKIRFLPTPGASFQDTSFAFKAYSKSKRYMMISDTLHHYRINPSSSVSSSGKVYCIIEEWAEIKRWIDEDVSLKKYISERSLFPRIVYGGFVWNYNRLNMILRLWFLRKASHFFNECKADGVFNLHEMINEHCGKELQKIMQDPIGYHHSRVYAEVDSYFLSEKESSQQPPVSDALVSVIVTCYNCARYIQASLSSICRQSYGNIEVICVDDCSSDETATLVRHAMRKDKRISWLCTDTNSGQSVARNLALERIKGQFVIFVDGDDLLMPNAIETLLKASDGVDVVIASLAVDYEGGEDKWGDLVKSDKRYYTNQTESTIDLDKDVFKTLDLNLSVSGKLWKSANIKKYDITFPKGLLYEDANFCMKNYSVLSKVKIIKTPVYLYHRHAVGSTMSNTFNKKKGLAIQHLYILEDFYNFMKEKEHEGRGMKILSHYYEPYFWFAYNNSPESDHDNVLSTMAKILEDQDADTSRSPILNYIRNFNKITKSQLFMQAFKEPKHSNRGLRRFFKFLR